MRGIGRDNDRAEAGGCATARGCGGDASLADPTFARIEDGTRGQVAIVTTSLRQRTIATLGGVLLAVALTSCGGGGQDADALLDTAFGEPIGSADVTLSVDLGLEGLTGAPDSLGARVEGPYRSGTDEELPGFAFDVSLDSGALPTPASGLELTSTGGNLFVELAGTAYELGEDVVAKEIKARQNSDQPDSFGVDPRAWIDDAEVAGEEEIDGVQTTHVTGTLSIPALIENLNAAASRAAELGDQTAPEELSDEQVARIDEGVGDPTFDVYVADDGKLRRVAFNVDINVSEADRAGLGGLSGGTIVFELDLANVGDEVTIEAPKNPQPLESLTSQLQGLGGSLSGGAPAGGALPGGVPPGADPTAPAPGGTPLPVAPDGGTGGAQVPGQPKGDAQAFQRYAQCLAKADQNDPEAAQRCSDEIPGGPSAP